METGTLKELRVQPGDVVEALDEGSVFFTKGWHYRIQDGLRVNTDEGCQHSIEHCLHPFRIVSRAKPPVDLTAITTPFGLLDPDTQEALRAHGGPYEYWTVDGKWQSLSSLFEWLPSFAYRIKTRPVRETVTENWTLNPDNGMLYFGDLSFGQHIRVTFDRVDGVIDLASYKLEAR